MDFITLGNTDLRVSVAGLGSGGFSRLGQGTGRSEAESIALIRQALDFGVNFIDTAAAYGTESIVGKALAGRDRDDFVISTKGSVAKGDDLVPADMLVHSLDQSLEKLGVDCIDVYHLHGVAPGAYRHVIDTLVPALLREKGKGQVSKMLSNGIGDGSRWMFRRPWLRCGCVGKRPPRVGRWSGRSLAS